MVDMNKLANGLENYNKALSKHEATVRAEFAQLKKQMARLSSVYEGTGATEFKAHFAASQRSLDDYVDGTRRIQKLLNDRVARLRAADRAGGL